MFQFRDYLLMAAAAISFALSVWLWFAGQREEGVFVGLWVPSILAFGVYVDQRAGRR